MSLEEFYRRQELERFHHQGRIKGILVLVCAILVLCGVIALTWYFKPDDVIRLYHRSSLFPFLFMVGIVLDLFRSTRDKLMLSLFATAWFMAAYFGSFFILIFSIPISFDLLGSGLLVVMTPLFFWREILTKLQVGQTIIYSLGLSYFIFSELGEASFGKILFALSLMPIFLIFWSLRSSAGLSQSARVRLSIWNGLIIGYFGLNQLNHVLSLSSSHWDVTSESFVETIRVTLEFLFLGLSCSRVLKEFLLFFGYILLIFPNLQDDYYNDELAIDVEKMLTTRYSSIQVPLREAVLATLFIVVFFVMNTRYIQLPTTLAIWCTFILVPLIIRLIHRSESVSGS